VKRHKFGEGPEAEERLRKRLEALKRILCGLLVRLTLALSPEANALLYLQCYQFILDGQIKALLNMGLPGELEVYISFAVLSIQGMVKDLWGLYISSLDIKIPKDEPAKVKLELDDHDRAHSPSDEQESSDEEGGNATDTTTQSRAFRSTAQELKKYPPLVISPIFCYLAIVTLRLPVTVSDIYSYDKKSAILTLDGLDLRNFHLRKCIN